MNKKLRAVIDCLRKARVAADSNDVWSTMHEIAYARLQSWQTYYIEPYPGREEFERIQRWHFKLGDVVTRVQHQVSAQLQRNMRPTTKPRRRQTK